MPVTGSGHSVRPHPPPTGGGPAAPEESGYFRLSGWVNRSRFPAGSRKAQSRTP